MSDIAHQLQYSLINAAVVCRERMRNKTTEEALEKIRELVLREVTVAARFTPIAFLKATAGIGPL